MKDNPLLRGAKEGSPGDQPEDGTAQRQFTMPGPRARLVGGVLGAMTLLAGAMVPIVGPHLAVALGWTPTLHTPWIIQGAHAQILIAPVLPAMMVATFGAFLLLKYMVQPAANERLQARLQQAEQQFSSQTGCRPHHATDAAPFQVRVLSAAMITGITMICTATLASTFSMPASLLNHFPPLASTMLALVLGTLFLATFTAHIQRKVELLETEHQRQLDAFTSSDPNKPSFASFSDLASSPPPPEQGVPETGATAPAAVGTPR